MEETLEEVIERTLREIGPNTHRTGIARPGRPTKLGRPAGPSYKERPCAA